MPIPWKQRPREAKSLAQSVIGAEPYCGPVSSDLQFLGFPSPWGLSEHDLKQTVGCVSAFLAQGTVLGAGRVPGL